MNSGTVDRDFIEAIGREQDNFSRLSSEFKIQLYRKHGAIIGNNVIFKPGALILSEHITVADDVMLGNESVVKADSITIGRLTYIGDHCELNARKITLHENVFLSKRIEIGGGGARDPQSEIEIGSHCHIGQDVHLNCCRKITIGEETTVSIGSMIMTHAFANSVLDGYPAVFAPVTVGNRVQLGLRVMVFPGVKIEDGAVVGSNSSVMSRVLANTYNVGVPARKIGLAKKEFSPERRLMVARGVMNDFIETLRLQGIEIHSENTEKAILLDVSHREGTGRVVLVDNLQPEDAKVFAIKQQETVFCFLHAPEGAFTDKSDPAWVMIDLIKKTISQPGGILTATLREFLRKRGIRLSPRTWSYQGGLI
jgi:acetyltransferase-like isoleucine patch superfamily enzyme